MGCKIHDCKAIEVGQLHENALRGTIGIALKSHRTHTEVENHIPHDLFRLRVNYRQALSNDGTGNYITSIGCDVRVVPCALYRNALHFLERRCIDHIDRTLLFANRNVDPFAIGADRDVVRMAAQLDLAGNLQCSSIYNVERTVGLVADVDVASVRCSRSTVIHFDARDLTDDFVGRRIDDIDIVTGRVRLNDPNLARRGGGRILQARAVDPCGERLPLRIVLRRPVFAAVVIWIAPGLFYQWVCQQFALGGIARRHAQSDDVEVLARVFFSPRGVPQHDRLQSHWSAASMTRNAARVTFTFRCQNGLYAGFEKLVVE